MRKAKLYLVVRSDLPPGQQAVQAAHALQEFNHAFHPQAMKWHATSNHLALLAVPDEGALAHLLRKAHGQRVAAVGFREPDRGDELTAIAIAPEGKQLTRRLPLALV